MEPPELCDALVDTYNMMRNNEEKIKIDIFLYHQRKDKHYGQVKSAEVLSQIY